MELKSKGNPVFWSVNLLKKMHKECTRNWLWGFRVIYTQRRELDVKPALRRFDSSAGQSWMKNRFVLFVLWDGCRMRWFDFYDDDKRKTHAHRSERHGHNSLQSLHISGSKKKAAPFCGASSLLCGSVQPALSRSDCSDLDPVFSWCLSHSLSLGRGRGRVESFYALLHQKRCGPVHGCEVCDDGFSFDIHSDSQEFQGFRGIEGQQTYLCDFIVVFWVGIVRGCIMFQDYGIQISTVNFLNKMELFRISARTKWDHFLRRKCASRIPGCLLSQ